MRADAFPTTYRAQSESTAHRTALRLGLGGAVLTLAGGVLLRTFAARPFLPVDESANVAYAMQVTHGHIPLAGPHRITPQFPGQRHAAQHASNHPPLYHAIVGPILRASLALNHPVAGVILARLVSLLFAAVAVLLAGLLAWTLSAGMERIEGDPTARRRRIMLTVAAAGLTGALPHLVTAAGIIENDSLSTALVLASLLLLVRIVMLGRTAARLAGLAACCAAASLTRVTSVPTVLIISAALGVAGLLWPADPDWSWGRRIGNAVWPPAVVLAATAAVAGWFLVLNQRRYGDWSGGKAVQSLIHAHEPDATGDVHYVLDRFSWLLQLQEVVGGPDSRHGHYPDSTRPLAMVLLLLLGIGVVALVGRVVFGQIRFTGRTTLCLTVLAIALCASMGEIAVHAVAGGLPHGRYLLPAAGAFLVAAAACLMAYPLRLGPLALGVALVLECWGTLRTLTTQLDRAFPSMGMWQTLLTGLRAVRIPDPTLVLIALMALMGVGVLLQVGTLCGVTFVRRAPAPEPAEALTEAV